MNGQYLYKNDQTETSVKSQKMSKPSNSIFKLNGQEVLLPTTERIHAKLTQMDPFGTNVVRQLLTNNFF